MKTFPPYVAILQFIGGAALCWFGFHLLGVVRGTPFLAFAFSELVPLAFYLLAVAVAYQSVNGLRARTKSSTRPELYAHLDFWNIWLSFGLAAALLFAAEAAADELSVAWLIILTRNLFIALAIGLIPAITVSYLFQASYARRCFAKENHQLKDSAG